MAELEIKPTSGMILRVTGIILSSVLIVGVLVWLLTGGGAKLFARRVDLKTYMPDATGLGPGAPVQLNGIQIGTVKSIAISRYLDMQRAVRVDLLVDARYLREIPSDSQTDIGSGTLIGDKFLDIDAGKSNIPAKQGTELRSEPEESAAAKADLMASLRDSLNKVDVILQQVASPDTAIGHYIVGEQEYDQALKSVDTFERSMRSLVARGNPASVVFNANLYTNWDSSLRRIDDSMQAIQRGQGLAGRLYVSDSQYTTLLAQVTNLRKSVVQVRADMEKAEPGLRNDDSYRKLTAMLASTDAMLAALNRGEGKGGELLTSPQLYESLVGSLKSLGDLLQDFDANPRKYLRTKLF